MYHQADGGDDNEHDYRNRVEQNAHVDAEIFSERQPAEVIGHQCLVGAVGQAWRAEVLRSRNVGQQRHHAQSNGADDARRAVRHPFSSYSQYEEGEERKE